MSTPSIQNNLLIGIWKLISATAIYADGTVTPDVYGTHPVGYITYTSDGHMMVMFSRSDRPLLSQEVRSPFSIHAKVRNGKIVYFQFMEDTFATARTFSQKGTWTIRIAPNQPEFEV